VREIVVYESSEYRVQSTVVEEILTDFFDLQRYVTQAFLTELCSLNSVL